MLGLLLRIEGQLEDVWITDEGLYKFKTLLQINSIVASGAAFLLAVVVYYVIGIVSSVVFWIIALGVAYLILFFLRRLDKEKRNAVAKLPLEVALQRADGVFLWKDVERFTLSRNKSAEVQMKPLNEYSYPKTLKITIKPSDADSLRAIASAKIGDRLRINDT